MSTAEEVDHIYKGWCVLLKTGAWTLVYSSVNHLTYFFPLWRQPPCVSCVCLVTITKHLARHFKTFYVLHWPTLRHLITKKSPWHELLLISYCQALYRLVISIFVDLCDVRGWRSRWVAFCKFKTDASEIVKRLSYQNRFRLYEIVGNCRNLSWLLRGLDVVEGKGVRVI